MEKQKLSVQIAKWQNEARGAYVIEVDDGCHSVIELAMPKFLEYEVAAGFYLCPAWASFLDRLPQWQAALSAPFLAVGNHTANHCPSNDLAVVEREIAEGDALIRRYFGLAPAALLSFAGPGGGDWPHNSPEERTLLQKYHNWRRLGFNDNIAGRSVSTAAQLIAIMDKAEQTTEYEAVVFHGIGGDWFNFDLAQFEVALQELKHRQQTRRLWVASSLAVQKYALEREKTQVNCEFDGRSIKVVTTSTLPWQYDEKLTLKIALPPSWPANVRLRNVPENAVTIRDRQIVIAALPNAEIELLQY